jgi:CRISPR-associated protein Cmr2
VQSFIAQARKTQDLFAGSRILSELIKAAITEIGESKVIFPKSKGESLPNRLVAVIEKDKNDLKTFGEKIENAVKDKFIGIANGVLGKLPKPLGFDDQIAKHLEIYWVFNEIKDTNYTAEEYQKTERLLGAIKNVRAFQQFTYNGIGETGRKCSLDGERNALFYKKTEKDRVPSFINEKETTEIEESDADEVKVAKGEGLSAVSFVKRFRLKDKFESTSEIALMDSLNKVGEEEVNKFKLAFGKGNLMKLLERERQIKINGKDWLAFNEQFFYEENLIEKNIPCKQQLEIAKERHKNLQKAFEKKEVKFNKYYAILLFDADSMGKWLSGDYLHNKENDLQAFHKHISSLLSGFAEYAKNYVDGLGTDKIKKGRTVYAGGDDYLGFVNLHYLFEVMKHLREEFKLQISDKIADNGKYKIEENKEMTFSAGIAIAHYKTPLNEVLNNARNLMKEAKKYFKNEKNAIGISFLTQATPIGETYLKSTSIETLKLLVDVFQEKKLSKSFILQYVQEMQIITGKLPNYDSFNLQVQMLRTELLRIMKRKSSNDYKDKIEKELFNPLFDNVLLYELDRDNYTTSLYNFTSFVKLAEKINAELL